MQNLFDLKKGQKCLIDKILTSGSMHRRFLDIGLTPDTLVECVNVSPQGDPKAFLIRGAVIAIRREDCENILIKEVLP
jgi:ferrous iron transport protein A